MNNLPERPGFVLCGREQKLVPQGNCLDVLWTCEAVCCRLGWDVLLTREEYESGRYEVVATCALSRARCESRPKSCPHLRLRLRRDEGGVCIYLDDDNRCSIYEWRPKTCQDFTCKGGWRLSSVHPPPDAPRLPEAIGRDLFMARLSPESIFVPHPLVRLIAVLLKGAADQVTFVSRLAGGCAPFRTQDTLPCSHLTEGDLHALVSAFGRREALGRLWADFRRERQKDISWGEFCGLVWVLHKHRLISDSRDFDGLLGNMKLESGRQVAQRTSQIENSETA
ncbi:MAG: YkgJ family cysteine cluster protein [candidate division WOR-3 bacterium]